MEENNFHSATALPAELPQLTSESVSFLLKAAKWGKFLAILGFIVDGLLFLAGIMMVFITNMVSSEMVPLNIPFSPIVFSIIYIIIAIVYLIPVIFLNSFSNNAIKAAQLNSTKHMTTSLRNLKNIFVFIGVLTVVFLAFYVIVLIIAGSAAMFSL